MALADIPQDKQSRRLDSWKEIAEYLRRDVRTATRWESQGLPLHRVAGAKGRSVFAFTDEIDAWLARGPKNEPAEPQVPVPSRRRFTTITITTASALGVIAIGVAVMSQAVAPLDHVTPQVTATTTAVSIVDSSGVSRVIHRFNPGAVLVSRSSVAVEDLDADGRPDLVAAVSFYDERVGPSASGELLSLSTAGAVGWRFAFDDDVTFGSGRVSGPWALSDWQATYSTTPARIAVAAHESTWWASLVAILDHNGRRLGTFANPGWIESVLWQSNNRLAVAGFNNMRDEAMFAVLDTDHLEGQAPGSAGTVFACSSCASTPPLFYATFPRSELNQLTAGRFNRARVSMVQDRVVVTTIEITREAGDATAVYEFDPDLRLVRARYSDGYWDEHLRLEKEGRLTHTRETCPERDGPAIHIWNVTQGWTKVTSSLSSAPIARP